MRLTLFAVAMFPMAAIGQEATLPAPSEPIAQSQSCATGMSWDATLQACVEMTEAASPMKDLTGGSGCNYGAAREVTS